MALLSITGHAIAQEVQTSLDVFTCTCRSTISRRFYWDAQGFDPLESLLLSSGFVKIEATLFREL
jgi:hypothetical protein